jgi:hypothetical protein
VVLLASSPPPSTQQLEIGLYFALSIQQGVYLNVLPQGRTALQAPMGKMHVYRDEGQCVAGVIHCLSIHIVQQHTTTQDIPSYHGSPAWLK